MLALALLVFLFGLSVGSFLNVCIYRLPRGESVIFPRSHCPHCGHNLGFRDNIPLLSFLLLRGRCRYCQEKISLRYPLIEISTGVGFLISLFQFGFSFKLAVALFFISVLILAAAIDLEHLIIPNKIIVPGMIVALILIILRPLFFQSLIPLTATEVLLFSPSWSDSLWSLGGFLAGAGFLLLVAFISEAILQRKAIGGGDIKLAAFMGLFLGLLYIGIALFFGFLVGTLVEGFLVVSGRLKRKEPVAFGPFLSIGGVITLFYGPQLLQFYLIKIWP